MERIFLECQVCLSTFNRICDFKSHVNSSVHQKKMVDVFQQDIVNGYVAIPSIVLINQPTKLRQVKQPIIGLSMCFSRGNYGSFYLCHVCEEKINTEKIISHLSSIDHCSNYFNRTNPNALSFSWIPSRNMSHILRREVTQEGKEKRRSELQMLNLPGNLSTQLKSCTYSEVMDILREKTKLVKQLEVKPKKTMIQTYQRDSNREHPLLGLQHLVECICVGQTERRYYLCTLCHLTVPARTIIKHVLSFDHIFCYFRVWHPSTLLARESYREYTKSFAAKMLDLAKQTEKIHGTANVDMKQVRLEPAKFTSVNFTCYAKALEELGSINKENKGSSLITNVTPGNKLEGQCSQQGKMGSCSVSSNSTSSNPASSNLASSNPASSKPASSNLVSSNVASSKPASSNPASSNPASSKASSNPASSKASSSPFSSKASSNPVSSNPDSSNPVSSNPASSKPASSNPASSNPVSSNPASSNPDSSNPVSSNPASSKPASSNPASSKPASSNPASSKPASSNPASSNPASSNSASSSPALTTSLDLHAICYKLHCQNCRKSFRCMSQYCRHVSTWEHKHMLKESRGGEWKPRLGLYKYLIESLRRNHPVTGVPLVVTLVTTQVQNEPLYICFACEDCFSESFVKQHFDSRKHVINTVLYQNPWRLTFAWENHLSMKDLRSMAWEEEMERPNQRMLKILDIPNWMLQSLGTLCYRKVMEKLELQHTLLKRDVPKCETYSKLQQNERFPLLGGQFLVMHDICIKGQQTTDVGFLCLLCCRRLSDDECYTHLFSLQHVAEFIDRFHPGSLNSSIDAETVLDLAKQAAYIHPISHVQVMKLDKPIWETCSYFKALSILMTANKGEGKARLQPPIVPGKKLFPRGTLKDVNKDHVRDNNQKNSRMVEGCEETTSQKSTDNSETTLNKMSVVGAGVTGSRCVESGENAEKGDDKETLTPSEKESEKRGGVFSETGSEEKRNAGNESCQAIKEEKIEEPTAGSGEAPESSQNTDKFYPTETGKERSESSKDVPTQLTQKRKVSPCTVEDVEQEMSHKRQRLTSKEDASCEAPQNLTSSKRAGQKEATTADKGENCKQSHETATYEGNVEIDGDSEESKSQPSSVTTAVSAVTETTSNTAKVSPESNEDVRMTCIKVSESADNADTCPCEDKAKIISNTTVGPLKIATTSKIEGTSETAADSTVTTPTTSMTAISKFTAKSSNCAPDTTKSAAPTSKLTAATSSCTTATKKLRETAYVCTSTISVCTATTSTSSATISSVTSITKSATLSKPLERRTGAAAKVTATSYKAAAASNTGSKAAREAVCRTAPASKVENASNNSENASKTVVASCTVVTSVATAKMTVKGKNTEASVKTAQMKSSVGSTADVAPNIHKAPAALCLIMPKNPPTEPSHNPASKKWQSASPPEVGLNQLMKVKCGEKKQVYCLLCSVRLRGRCHVTDFTHQYNYAKMKSPEQVSELKPSELQRELTKLVTLLAEADRDVGSQSFLTVKVNIDDYKELAALSADKAIGRLKAIMRQKDLMRASSTSTTDTDASPCEVSSQDDESSSKEEGAPAVGPSNRAQSVKSSEPEANDLIPDQLHSCSISNNNKPNANRSVQDAGIAGSFAKTPDTCQETPEKRQQQERSRPELQDTRKVLEGSQKASTVKLLNPDPLSSAATVNTEQQNKPGPRRRAQDVSEHSQVLPMISILFSNNNKPNANRSVQDAGIAGSFAKTPDTCQETPEKRQQQERSRPELQDTRKVLEGSQKASTVKLLNPDPLSSAATVNTEQQNKPGPRRRAQDVSEHSQVLPMISILFSNNNKPNANRSVQDAGIAAVKMVKAKCYVPPLATDAAGSFAKTPDTCQETPEKRQQQERSRPELQDTWKVQEGSQKASTVKLLNPDPLSSAATVNTEQQNKPGPRRRAQDVSEHSQVLPMISIGESSEGRSHLSIYLNGHEPIIGLGLMWECRVMTVRTFYLCESCSETLLSRDIVQHMRSDDHQYNFIRMRHPGFLYFWSDELLLPWMKLNILKGIVKKVSKQERFNEMDAQVILLGKEMFKPVWTASFSDALKLVKEIKKQKKLTIPHPSIFSPQQKDKQPESRQSPEESLPTEVQPSQALETDQRSDNGAKQKTEKHPLEEMDGDLDGVKQRSPLDVTRVSPKADPVISPFSGAGTCLSPQEQPEPRPPVSQHQRPIPELQVKQVELHSESPSSSIVCPKTSQTLSVSPRDEYFPTRKRAAVESIETLVRSCTNNPQLEDPLPALCSELQPISAESASESTSVKPAATSTLLSPMDKDTEPGFDEQDTPAIDMEKFDDLMALLRKMKSELNMSPCTSAPGKSETTTSCANNSSESGVERRQDPEPVQTTSNVATKQARWDSKWQMLKVTKNPPSANSLEMFSTAAPEVLSHGNQLVASNASSVITSSPEGSTFTRGDLLFGVTEANAVTQLPSASTADPSDPQNQNDAQSTFGSQPHPSPIYDNPGQIPQPRDNTETDSTGVRQLPINAIVSVRSNRHNQRFMGSYNRQDPTEVNNQVTHSFSTGATVSPSDASGGYGQYRQMAYFANGLSGYFSTEAVGSYTAPANPPVYTESSYQCEGFTTGAPNPSPIYPEQGATRFSLQSFGHILTAPALPEWVKLGLYQQQLLPQQYSSWRSTSLAAGDGTVISEAAYGGAAPVTTPATSSQKMINLNDYRTLRVAPTQSSSNVAAQNVPQTYVNPPVVHYPPGANTEITSQPPANSFFASGGGFYVVEK
ncbi:uncharacterized protein LOC119503881 isoform X3 [Sebastes umbrosus]|uniref:uncharacterized protein LOC119503881 isoform X3 n=1 Tax=Sebastes umbrosus TaxID=72105 RepID=UPI0018A11CB7|nr:uncharacterized protein LOC119503881 isoform X3 [Sebastes umbrosus]